MVTIVDFSYGSTGVGGGSGDITNGGNTTGAAITVGTNDNYDFNLEANGSTVATARSDGSFMVGNPMMMNLGGALMRVESNPWDASGDYAHINNEMYKNGNAHTGKIIGKNISVEDNMQLIEKSLTDLKKHEA